MAVFTAIDEAMLSEWLAPLNVGALLRFEGIAAGIENSNYFVDTDRGRWVLTLFERLQPEQLPFYLQFMRHLAERGLSVPAPQVFPDGSLFAMLAGKPASLVTCLRGRANLAPGAAHCRVMGATLAQAHLAGADFPLHQPNLRGLGWWQAVVPQVLPHVPDDLRALLLDELQAQASFQGSELYLGLPRGPVHADLFRDNVLFDGETLGGIIDFYFAGCDAWLFDLAVAVNDWCLQDLPSNANGCLEPALLEAFMAGYTSVRPLSADEQLAWPMMLRTAAMRFWVSRLFDFYLPRPAQVLTPHDPRHFERVLRQRRLAHPAS